MKEGGRERKTDRERERERGAVISDYADRNMGEFSEAVQIVLN